MIGENRQLVTYESVELRNNRLKFKIAEKINDHSRGIYRVYPTFNKGNRRMFNMPKTNSHT